MPGRGSASRSTEFSNIGSRSKKYLSRLGRENTHWRIGGACDRRQCEPSLPGLAQQHNEPTSVSLLLRIILDQPKG